MSLPDERLIQLTDRLESGIRELYTSGRYAAYLAAMSRFHQYSYKNALLILLQCPAATRVAGYHTWKTAFGRQVKAGSVGIKIFAPCVYRKVLETEDPDEAEKKTIPFYKVVTVFDESQTEGRELPSLGASALSGDVPDFENIYARLAALSPLPVEQGPVPGQAKGYTSFTEGKIVIRPGMSQVQTVKTLIHELAHARLHDPKNQPKDRKKPREQKEVEAESIAYVVCQYFGIDTGDYSFGYVAGWSKGRELEELKDSLDLIHSTASEIIHTIQPPPVQKLEPPRQERQKKQTRKKR